MLKQILIFSFSYKLSLDSSNIYIGVYVREPDLPTLLKFNLKGGVIIDSVMKDSPASKAGLKKNQIIWKIDNHVLTNEEDFRQKLKEYNENDKILFTVKDNYKLCCLQSKLRVETLFYKTCIYITLFKIPGSSSDLMFSL